ncbi:hypothetical protein Jab_1c19460 [Janthinobacterium sp. HH01]|uniref:hypothetical protein n=1 Tax=Janthinobacterium sp. HH01 TaxID=1198452 RepID=UPI0002AEB8D3|nr:hypothetical protein [Janthinobacterium sp. HH01]ELX13323.1 hypothetical protein Jab_1c19460 [Janthinobacterium sp. HH01]
MAKPMSSTDIKLNVATLVLRARLLLVRLGAPACVALALCLAGAAAWGWLLPQRAAQARLMAQPLPTPTSLVTAPPPPSANQNLAGFYEVLGENRYAEQQVKVLFDLAAKNNLTLSLGEYKAGYDKASRVSTYQIILPVKGPYQSIWQFAMQGLREMPFASLDDIGFRRESIAESTVEARLRFTLYLKDGEP